MSFCSLFCKVAVIQGGVVQKLAHGLFEEQTDLKLTVSFAYAQQFLASNPSLTEIRSEILHYATFEQEIEDLKPTVSVGPIELNTGTRSFSLYVGPLCTHILLRIIRL